MITTESRELLETQAAETFVASLLRESQGARACLTSSLQVEDMVVLHLLRQHVPDIPVIFLDTGYHFAETYAYRDRMVQEWSINLINVLPETTVAQHESKLGKQYLVEPTQCCQSRKVAPLMRSLEPFGLWFTGLRREQSPTRANLKKVEEHQLPTAKKLWKLSPLADWTWQQVWDYITEHKIPHLSLYDQGYRSIGCEPCTQLSTDPNNPRAGRWGGKKLECGIHTFSEAKS
ncbi:MAG TPA: phosphoadenylyl-sulfate reductase [Acidobacteriaceae bacterium]|jgi:phosphoadenosine phosphosulfate reductase|nr:phosphoadenylyl-sulfate reductase [Acidobacteriaceae bacterium]